ncbi:hypothetical protein GCM10009118_00010 [Wandonia haliotis]|uniref:Uncharacterized protein n=1 Tax=Wandonia haliotis TaxID=574963 RepID=A0ABN1MKB1_9FLAO
MKNMESNRFSVEITVFHGRKPPEEGTLVGYEALIHKYELQVPRTANTLLNNGRYTHHTIYLMIIYIDSWYSH